MLHTTPELPEAQINPHRLYELPDAAAKVGLSVWHFRQKAVAERRIAYIRHSLKGKILFRGSDLLSYLDACRQPAIGEKVRAAVRKTLDQSAPRPEP